MVNHRILQLIEHPEMMQHSDLEVLESEIQKYPYVQSIRVLYLLATHQFSKEIYQDVLSTTAAYTTDKKILYHFVNQFASFSLDEEKEQRDLSRDIQELHLLSRQNHEISTEQSAVLLVEQEKEISPTEDQLGTRVLEYTTEISKSNFTEFRTENKSTLQQDPIQLQVDIEHHEFYPDGSATILDHQVLNEYDIISPDNDSVTHFYLETNLDEGNLSQVDLKVKITEANELSQEEEIQELSLHDTEGFLPQTAFTPKIEKENYVPKPSLNKHEEEMKRLVAEVEAKIKAKRQEKKAQEQIVPQTEELLLENQEISFSETQDFSSATEMNDRQKATEKPEWKPMQVAISKPDSLERVMKNTQKESYAEGVTNVSSQREENLEEIERPTVNLSFFSDDFSVIESERLTSHTHSHGQVTTPEIQEEGSNISQFINTWQNWLKIEREEEKSLTKEAVIDKFLENEPKISKLKEDSNFVVKEKEGDISHLMTETLARLYVEQKLYAKGIKAYEILQKKYPEKSDNFSRKIEEIKQIRLGK